MTDPKDPEALCQRCGRCCYFKTETDSGVTISNVPCPNLDLRTMECLVYPVRSMFHWCHSAVEALRIGPSLPADCPITVAYAPKDYVPPKETPNDYRNEITSTKGS